MRQIQPFISVIITTYNRPRQLSNCLKALVRQIYSRNCFEVIVVDDGGEVFLDTVLAPFHKQLNLTLLKQANSGPATARNTGAACAKGIFFVFTDDDCTPCEEWLNVVAIQIEKTPEYVIGGKIVYNLSNNAFAITSQMILDIVYQHYNKDHAHALFFSACNMAVPAKQFLEIGGFDPSFRTSEDREFCERWLKNGHKMKYVPEAKIYHNDYVMSLIDFCKRYFNYGRGAYRFHKIRSLRGSGSIQEEMKFHTVLPNWISYPFKQAPAKRAYIFASLLLIWQASNLTGLFYEMICRKRNLNFPLPTNLESAMNYNLNNENKS